mmetsp:Transcript_144247/g.203999  ORF Transcript_144247/g.203999 Transcript_144247/m.203999 type:complete len:85 (-) Transcript_144247:13-267(-)
MSKKCPTCNKTVYSMEAIKSGDMWFHRLCFKCGGCGTALAKGKEQKANGKAYCRKCFTALEGHSGFRGGVGGGTVDSHQYHTGK